MLTDTISNILTMIRNANARLHQKLFVPYSKLTLNICEKMKSAGFLTEFWRVKNDDRKVGLKIKHFNKVSGIRELKRISKPSRRIYMNAKEIEKSFHIGRRVYFISTSKGLKTNVESISQKVGGEVLFYVG